MEVAITEKDSLVDAHLTARELGVDPAELEISAERMHTIPDSAPNTFTPDSTSTAEDTSASTDDTPEVPKAERPSKNDVQSSSASKNTDSADDWHGDFFNSGKSFTQRHKLKYV